MLKIGGQSVSLKTLLLVAADSLLIVVSLLIATAVRFLDLRTVTHYLYATGTFARFGLVVLVCVLALYYNDLYDFRLLSRRSEIFVPLLQALGIACLALALLYYVDPDLSLGRGIAMLAAPPIVMFVLGWRLLLDTSGLWLRRPERVLIVGTGATGISLVRAVHGRSDLALRVVGFLDEKGENIGKSLVNPGIIGGTEDVEKVVAQQKIDRVVLSLAERRGRTPVRQLLHLKFAGVSVEDAHSLYERLTGRIISDGFRKPALMLRAKRVCDVLVSLFGIVLALPLMALIALAIRLETGTPILYRQTRVGLWSHPFEMLKFRSMHQNAEANGPCWAAADDRRITLVGRILRRLRVDELPQLYNVLRGQMSLVGPRPERPEFCALLEQEIPYFAQRHTVRPGITGWAQVKYQYGASVEEIKTKLEYDLFYIKHLSILLDLAIIFETAKVMLRRRGAK